MQATIKKAVILVELEDQKVHLVSVKQDTIKSFLRAIASQEGALKIVEEPINDITLEFVEP